MSLIIVILLVALLMIQSILIYKLRVQAEKKVPKIEYDKILAERNSLTSERDVAKDRNEQNEVHLDELKDQLIYERQNTNNLSAKLSEKEANYLNLQEKLDTQKQELEQLQKKFSLEFENLANRIFDEKSTKFSKQNSENLDLILKPLSEKITDFKKKVEDVYSSEATERATLKVEIKNLFELNQQITKDAQNLTLALKGESKTQGSWGELILKRILEISGLEEGREFKAQGSFANEEGKRQQPDVIIYLPDNKHMIIDSKVSLTAYEKYYNEDNEEKQQQHLKEHLISVKNHIKMLSEKNYHSLYQIDTPDFVLMFLPIDPAFGLAFQADPQIYSNAFERGVILVSPLSLLATLRTISSVWKKDYQNRNVLEIARQGGALYDKFVSFLEDLQNIGRYMGSAQKAYDSALNKLSVGTGNLLNRTEALKKLGAKATKSIPAELFGEELSEL